MGFGSIFNGYFGVLNSFIDNIQSSKYIKLKFPVFQFSIFNSCFGVLNSFIDNIQSSKSIKLKFPVFSIKERSVSDILFGTLKE